MSTFEHAYNDETLDLAERISLAMSESGDAVLPDCITPLEKGMIVIGTIPVHLRHLFLMVFSYPDSVTKLTQEDWESFRLDSSDVDFVLAKEYSTVWNLFYFSLAKHIDISHQGLGVIAEWQIVLSIYKDKDDFVSARDNVLLH